MGLVERLAQATEAAHGFWFEPSHQAHWFASTADFDEQLEARFGALISDLSQQSPDTLCQWPANAQQRLGLILLCDQFPRNIFRGQAKAYALDPMALGLAKVGITKGEDTTLELNERCFFYLPLEHSEQLLDQHTCVGLFSQLRDNAKGDDRAQAGNYLRHAQQHRDIITRFGRFPHRNAVLQRTSSAAEAEFAKGGSFGQ